MIGSKADHNHNDYHFLRHHSGDTPEPLQPLRPLWHECASAVGLILFFAAVVLVF